MLARLRILALVLAALVGAPALGHAQQTKPARAASAAGPRLELTATAVRHVTQSADSASLVLAQKKNVGRPVALMLVGGAAIVLGILIGGDIGTLFEIGGAVVVLVGLYQYLQ
jgi:hypothetical protein